MNSFLCWCDGGDHSLLLLLISETGVHFSFKFLPKVADGQKDSHPPLVCLSILIQDSGTSYGIFPFCMAKYLQYSNYLPGIYLTLTKPTKPPLRLRGGAPINPPVPAPVFTCLICNRSFSTKRGLGVHARTADPEEYHAQNLPVLSKPRWTEAKSYLLGSYEASILKTNPQTRIINQLLLEKLPGRSLEAIKGQRRKATHKELVMRLCNDPPAHDPLFPLERSPLDNTSTVPTSAGDDVTKDFEQVPERGDLTPHNDEPNWQQPLRDAIVELCNQLNYDSSTPFPGLISAILEFSLLNH